MEFHDIKEREYYLYDRNNTEKQVECGVNIVQVVSKKWNLGLFPHIQIAPVNREGEILYNEKFNTKEGMLSPMSKNINENVIIRYPTDVPTFSAFDTQIFAKVANFIASHQHEANMSDQELLIMTGLLNKVSFYAEIMDKYTPTGGSSNEN